MRSSRLAVLAVTVGSGLLGWSTVGVTAIAGNVSRASGGTVDVPRHDHEPDGGHEHGHHGNGTDSPGV
ncbi:MAG TPA: hypothetical protein VGO71_04975 [Baekduia sp.]|jgi:hypothetical protein|nr:hypothetical protein [Baekduia sp.]